MIRISHLSGGELLGSADSPQAKIITSFDKGETKSPKATQKVNKGVGSRVAIRSHIRKKEVRSVVSCSLCSSCSLVEVPPVYSVM
jgi:hypothetical protein